MLATFVRGAKRDRGRDMMRSFLAMLCSLLVFVAAASLASAHGGVFRGPTALPTPATQPTHVARPTPGPTGGEVPTPSPSSPPGPAIPKTPGIGPATGVDTARDPT